MEGGSGGQDHGESDGAPRPRQHGAYLEMDAGFCM